MSEFKLSEEKKKLYELFLREEINFMEYINGRNDLDKEFIKRLKEELKKEFDYTFWANYNYDECLILENNFAKKVEEIFNKHVGDLK